MRYEPLHCMDGLWKRCFGDGTCEVYWVHMNSESRRVDYELILQRADRGAGRAASVGILMAALDVIQVDTTRRHD